MTQWKKYQSIPFVDQGRSGDGCDCWGLVCLIYKQELGVHLPTFEEVSAMDGEKINGLVKKHTSDDCWKLISLEDLSSFDVVVMRGYLKPVDGRRSPAETHIGIMIDGSRLMHTEIGSGVTVVDTGHQRIVHRILSAYRYEAN